MTAIYSHIGYVTGQVDEKDSHQNLSLILIRIR
jgi:hypothetical protein